RIYLIFWGWGEKGAWAPGVKPTNQDPQGVAARLKSFVAAIGGSQWSGTQTQYYETVNGKNISIHNDAKLGGVWFDNTDAIHDNLSGLDLAKEADRGRAHFQSLSTKPLNLANSNFVVATPHLFNDAGFNKLNYCAYH